MRQALGFFVAGLAFTSLACGGKGVGNSMHDAPTDSHQGGAGGEGGQHAPLACLETPSFDDAALRMAVEASLRTVAADEPFAAESLAKIRLLTSYEPIASLAGLECLTSLQILMLNRGGALSDLRPIADLFELEALSLPGPFPELSDVAALGSLSKLTSLHLGATGVVDISSLARLHSLRFLSLGDNRVDDVSALTELTQLEGELQLQNNRISDVAPLASLSNLRSLNLGSNQITDVTPLAEKFCLTQSGPKLQLCSLYLGNNPLDCQAQAAQLAALRARGVDLFTDCEL